MLKVRSAAVYARISSDPSGTALGVGRQLADCRDFAARQGWVVAEEYVDNDLSASSGKRRPAYERMLADMGEGLRDAVVSYHPDRLTRRLIELERFVEVAERGGVREVRFVSGPGMVVGDGDSLMVLRIQGVMAAKESSDKSRRVRRKMNEVAAAGLPHGGSNRPFGYEADKMTVRPDEAEVIRRLVARYIAGESLRSLTVWLDGEGIQTVKGGAWRSPTVRDMLGRPRYAGLRDHRGDIVGPAAWPAIISEADRDKVLARMAEQTVTGRRSPRKYLLTGLLRCGRCDSKLYSSPRATSRRYVCVSGPDHGGKGCGRLTVVAAPLEELVSAAVLYRLDTPDLVDVLAGRAAQDEQAAAESDALARDRAQLVELSEAYAARDITMQEWRAARSKIAERVERTERRLARMTGDDALAGLVGNGAQVREQWAGLNLTRQHAIVRALLDHAVISPGTQGARELDHNRVDLVWRL